MAESLHRMDARCCELANRSRILNFIFKKKSTSIYWPRRPACPSEAFLAPSNSLQDRHRLHGSLNSVSSEPRRCSVARPDRLPTSPLKSASTTVTTSPVSSPNEPGFHPRDIARRINDKLAISDKRNLFRSSTAIKFSKIDSGISPRNIPMTCVGLATIFGCDRKHPSRGYLACLPSFPRRNTF